MIDPMLVPEEIREVTELLDAMSVDEWSTHTANWHPGTRQVARMIRKMGESERSNQLRSRAEGISDLLCKVMPDEEDDPGTALWILLYCLSNSTLDRLISTF